MRAALTGLRDKYAKLIALRLAAAAGSDADPRSEMAELAARFPGALRELDRRPLQELHARLEALQAALCDAGPEPPWAELQAAYHGTMRAVLRLRPALRACASEAEADACLRLRYAPLAEDEPARDEIDEALVAGLWRPPGGRLNPVVLRFLARTRGIPTDGLEHALFGDARACSV